MALLVGASKSPRGLQRLMVPGVCLLIAFLGYGSQWLFATATDLAPGPPSPTESWIFNILLGCLWWTYYKACSVDPGHYKFPPASSAATALVPASSAAKNSDADADLDPDADVDGETVPTGIDGRRRWCKKCRRPKAPRAHHCRACGRCVPRMDHHCPWTGNCVSLQSFPHFLRFLVFTNASLWALLRLTYQRFAATLWGDASRLPAYLGPSPGQLALLTVIAGTAALVALALGILLVTTLRAWAFNMTMIETWEHDRHEAVLARRGGSDGEDWWREGGDGDGGSRGRATLTDPVEFPYDIGIFSNMAQAMGTSFPLLWFFPFSGAPEIAAYPFVVVESSAEGAKSKKQDGQQQQPARPLLVTRRASPAVDTTGWAYEENGLNDREGMWPPVDPEKARNARMWRRRRQELDAALAAEQQQQQQQGSGFYAGDERAAFRARQEQDLLRWRGRGGSHGPSGGSGTSTAMPMRPGMGVRVGRDEDARWTNADGDQLGDYGVDEDAEFDDGDVEEDMLMDGAGGRGGEGDDEDNGWFFGATGGEDSGDEDDDDEDGGRRARGEGDEDEDVPLAELIRKIKGEQRGPA